jgi:hypothetical protein
MSIFLLLSIFLESSAKVQKSSSSSSSSSSVPTTTTAQYSSDQRRRVYAMRGLFAPNLLRMKKGEEEEENVHPNGDKYYYIIL